MKNINIFFVTLCLLSFSPLALSLSIDKEDVPEEFKDFFKEEKKLIEIEYPGEVYSSLVLNVSFDTVKIGKNDEETQRKLYEQLLEQNVRKEVAKEIVENISSDKGLVTSDKCQGYLDKCVVLTKYYDIVFNHDNNKLRFFFSSEILNKKKKKIYKYASGINNAPALINKSSLFVNTFKDDIDITLNDKLLQGLKYGYIESEFSVKSDNTELHKLAYNLDIKNKKYKVGYFSYDNSMNTTDFLESFTNTDVLEMSFGSSNKLLLDNSGIKKKIEIYSPSSGLLSIKKNGTYIRQYDVKSGQQDILYSSLPKGVYNIEVSIKSGNKIVFQQEFKVYNVGDGSLAKDDLDYRFQVGILKSNDVRNEDVGKDYLNKLYGTSKFSYGITDNLMLGGALTLSEKNQVYQFGLNYIISSYSSLSANSKLYNEGSYLVDFDVYSSILNFRFRKFKLNDSDYFAEYTEDDVSYISLNASRTFDLGLNLSAGLYYSYSKYDENKVNSLTGNLSYLINSNSNVDFESTYKKDDSDSLDFNVSYTYNFDSGSNLRTEYSHDDIGSAGFSSEYTTKDLIEGDDYYLTLNGRSELRNKNDNMSSLNVSASYNDEHLTSSYYGSIDSKGTNSQNLMLSSNQIISDSGLSFSSNNADSYLKLNVNKSNDIKDNDTYGSLSIKENNRSNRNVKLNKNNKIISLKSYHKYNNKIDTSAALIENTGTKSKSFFSMPGTVQTLDLDLTKIVSFVGSYSDIYDNSITDLKCEGNGCVDIEKIDENVFKVAIRSGKEFILKSDMGSYTCLTPQVRDIRVLNIGKSYCIPELIEDDNGVLVYKNPKTNDTQNLVYLGIFNDKNKWKYNTLKNNIDYKIIEKKFGNDLNLVYVEFKSEDPIYIANIITEKLNKVMLTADIPRNDLSKYVLLLDDSWR